MAIHLTPALTATLSQIAAETNSSADELTQRTMEAFAAEYQEIRDAVAESDAEFERGEFLSHEEVFAQLNERLNNRPTKP